MVNYYTSQALANYNDNPPSDGGEETEPNRGNWSTVINEVGDPLKTFGQAIDTELGNLEGRLFLNGSTTQSTNYTVQASDLGKIILASNGITVTLLAAATAGDGFITTIKNVGTADVTVDGDGSEEIDDDTSVTVHPGDAVTVRSNGSKHHAHYMGGATGPSLPRGYISGLVPSNHTDADHDISFAVGEARDDSNIANLVLASALVKQFDVTWAVGTNAGGFASGESLPTSGTIHCWLIRRSDTGVVDVFANDDATSGTSPTLPTDYDQKRRIFSGRTDASANILPFVANETEGGGLEVLWKGVQDDLDDSSIGTGARQSVSLTVPNGVSVEAFINAHLSASTAANRFIYLSNLSQNDEAPSLTTGIVSQFVVQNEFSAANHRILTNTGASIGLRASGTTLTIDLATNGFRDFRR